MYIKYIQNKIVVNNNFTALKISNFIFELHSDIINMDPGDNFKIIVAPYNYTKTLKHTFV